MVKRVKWTIQAEHEFVDILDYWVKRNKSITFSLKLVDLFEEAIVLISTFPEIGQQTDIQNIRRKVVRDYLIFYRIDGEIIHILNIWDPRQDPDKLKLR